MSQTLIEINRRLSLALKSLNFASPVHTVYNPLDYAWENFRSYLERWGQGRKRVVYLGMNPGPWGMAQTGIPFGDVRSVGEWLGLDGRIRQPEGMHPKRPIQGLKCQRVEVSGSRLWGWVRDRWGHPDAFFEENFVLNYCPLVFMEAGGKNRTPVNLPADERRPLEEICDQALAETIDSLDPEWIIGIGAFAEQRAAQVCGGARRRIGKILHPSPASPAANRGWREQAEAQLVVQGVYSTGRDTG